MGVNGYGRLILAKRGEENHWNCIYASETTPAYNVLVWEMPIIVFVYVYMLYIRILLLVLF